uniref:Uncharacterized protein n=1 Tax=Pipistrellus kuhlii TaxID=59472 RepID=A0A7J7UTG1_PIPKU|nr:hypothetical protein mPipKuh1_008679 [Pipistrellus kuhlii]
MALPKRDVASAGAHTPPPSFKVRPFSMVLSTHGLGGRRVTQANSPVAPPEGQKLLGLVSTVAVLRWGQLCSPRDEAACPGDGGGEPAGLAAVDGAQPHEEPRPEAEGDGVEGRLCAAWKRPGACWPAAPHLPAQRPGVQVQEGGGQGPLHPAGTVPSGEHSPLQASPQWSPPLPNAMVSPPAVSTPGRGAGRALQPRV